MQLDDQALIIEAADFFSMCTSEQRRLLAFASEQRNYAAGDVIYAQGDRADGAYQVMAGMVRLSAKNGGSARGRVVESPDVVIGELGLFLDKPRRSTLKAVTNCTLLFIPQTAFKKLLRQDPELAGRTAERLKAELDDFLAQIAQAAQKIKG